MKSGLPLAARLYVFGVIASAGGVLGVLVPGSRLPANWTAFAVLAALFLVCDAVPAQLAVKGARVSMSYAAILAAVVLLGPAGAALVGATAVATPQRISSPVKRLFNGAQFTLCGWTSGQVFELLRPRDATTEQLILPFAVALTLFVAVNLGLMGGVLLLGRFTTLRELVRGSGQLCAECLGFGSFGLLIAEVWDAVHLLAPILVLLPLVVATWAFAQVAAQQAAQEATVAAMCQAVETKDLYTRGHSERVSRGAVMIAEELGLRAARVEAIRYAGMLHDVGKLGVPTKILQKDGPLTEAEFAAIQLHPMRGVEVVADINFLDEMRGGILHHHEKLDGKGYPLGLAGEEIPEFARIIAVADTFDAMTSTRSYRPARPIPVAVAELKRCAGTEFDPSVVGAFLRALEHKGWELPDPPPPPAPGDPDVARHDHDDPTVPLQVVPAENEPPA